MNLIKTHFQKDKNIQKTNTKKSIYFILLSAQNRDFQGAACLCFRDGRGSTDRCLSVHSGLGPSRPPCGGLSRTVNLTWTYQNAHFVFSPVNKLFENSSDRQIQSWPITLCFMRYKNSFNRRL